MSPELHNIIDILPSMAVLFAFTAAVGIGVGSPMSTFNIVSDQFDRDDASTIFTDQRIAELHATFTPHYRRRLKQTIFGATVFFIFYIGLFVFFRQELTEGKIFYLDLASILILVAMFLRFGAARSLLKTTEPLVGEKREEMEQFIISSEFKSELITFINENPKDILVEIDLLNLQSYSRKLHQQKKKIERVTVLAGLKK